MFAHSSLTHHILLISDLEQQSPCSTLSSHFVALRLALAPVGNLGWGLGGSDSQAACLARHSTADGKCLLLIAHRWTQCTDKCVHISVCLQICSSVPLSSMVPEIQRWRYLSVKMTSIALKLTNLADSEMGCKAALMKPEHNWMSAASPPVFHME